MNCNEIQKQLGVFVTGDLPAQQIKEIRSHLADCAGCRDEHQVLQQVLFALDAAAHESAQVDVSRVYQRAAALRQRQARRWRWAAGACAAAAVLLLVFTMFRMQIHVDENQITLRWHEPAPHAKKLPDKDDAHKPPAKITPNQMDLHMVKELIHTLAAEMGHHEDQRQQELRQLQAELIRLQSDNENRWNSADRQFTLLYTAQFGSEWKGDKP